MKCYACGKLVRITPYTDGVLQLTDLIRVISLVIALHPMEVPSIRQAKSVTGAVNQGISPAIAQVQKRTAQDSMEPLKLPIRRRLQLLQHLPRLKNNLWASRHSQPAFVIALVQHALTPFLVSFRQSSPVTMTLTSAFSIGHDHRHILTHMILDIPAVFISGVQWCMGFVEQSLMASTSSFMLCFNLQKCWGDWLTCSRWGERLSRDY